MTTKSKTITVNFVDCGPFGHYLPSKEVTRFQDQAKFVAALKEVAVSIAEFRLTRDQAAAKLFEVIPLIPQDFKHTDVPPSLDKRLGFSKYGVVQRIAQDFAGTGPIDEDIKVLRQIVGELESGLGMFLVFATRAPDADTERATELWLAAEVRSKLDRASRGVRV
ncbi:hypothetical protein [Variovorax sp. JS1663]|uniref:hypothetical protein n=1 Tax=Variovorax sp. JS1663 TaxID=1851577 RepID=UPI000B3475D6|nr:hypothetical protein [Variovorax sp. JS1663]OUL98770.1 hypothetical protein A8M77_29960 [Variovorax sp. JS1663]